MYPAGRNATTHPYTTQTITFTKNKEEKQSKVILLGDSHIRGCAGKLADLLGNSYSVMGITKPNANTKGITDSLNLQTEKTNKERRNDPL